MTSTPPCDPAPAASVRLNKLVRAPRRRVFRALTSAEEFPHWFAPAPEQTCRNVVVEPWVGGRFRFEMTDGQGKQNIGNGTFLEVIENEKIVYNWTWESMPDFGGDSQVTFELHEADNPYEDAPATEIILIHERLTTAQERSEHLGGWWLTLRALGYHVRGIDPREVMFGKSRGSA